MKKKFINALAAVVFCVLAILLLVVIYNRSTGKVPMVGNRAFVWVLTGSMEDTIPERSYILIEGTEDAASEISEGDIITFYSTDENIKGSLNTHRVVGINPDEKTFITKGDNNPTPDSYQVPYENVVGKYVKNLPILTFFGRIFATKTGFVVFSLLGIILISAFYLPDFIKVLRGKNKTSDEKEKIIKSLVELEIEKLKNSGKSPEQLREEQASEVKMTDKDDLPTKKISS